MNKPQQYSREETLHGIIQRSSSAANRLLISGRSSERTATPSGVKRGKFAAREKVHLGLTREHL